MCARRLLVACVALAACNVGVTRISGEGVPCSSDSQCENGEVCFLGECRGSSTALSTVLAEVRPPPGSGYGTLQLSGIDLRQSVLVDFNLEPSLTASGQVLQLLGAVLSLGTSPVSGANVTFAARARVIPDRPMQLTVPANSGGAFSTRLPAGTWDATIAPPAPLPPIASALGLSSSNVALQLLLPSAALLARVQGTIVAGTAPLAGARVLAVDGTGAPIAAAASADAAGNFQLLLPPGAPAYYLRVGPASDGNSAGGAAAMLLPTYVPAGPFDPSSAAIRHDFGTAPAAAFLSGTVVDSGGAPVVGARVYALSLDGANYVLSSSTLSDGGGAYRLPLLEGRFAVEAAPPSSGDAPGLSAEQDLQLVAPGVGLSIVCPPRVSATGHLLQANGKPVPAGTQISATRLPDRLVTSRVAQTQPSDASGDFTLLADTGTYRVSIVPPAASGLSASLVELTIAAGTTSLPTLQLPQPLQVVGTVAGLAGSGGAGAPIAGATVEFFALDSSGSSSISLGSGLTDSAGRYLAILPDVQQPAASDLARR